MLCLLGLVSSWAQEAGEVTLREGGKSVGLRGDTILEGKEGKKDFSWKADLARMGFTAPIEELNQGEMVGQKWLMGGGRPGFFGGGESRKGGGNYFEF